MSGLSFPAVDPAFGSVRLRPYRDSDVDMLMDLAQDPYLPLIGTLPPHADRAGALDFIARQHERLADGRGWSFCVVDADSDDALGGAGLTLQESGRASGGYSIAPRSRGRGAAGQALRALTRFAWTVGLHRVELYIEPWNAASLRTAANAGYQREGLLRSHHIIGGERTDMVLYASVREDQA